MAESRLISRLNQDTAKLYGREEELKCLRDRVEQIRKDEEPLHTLFLAGESGTGKSALIERAFTQDRSILFGYGKYEEQSDPKPFAALLAAITELCENAVAKNKFIIQHNIEDSSCLPVLAGAMPGLQRMLGITEIQSKQNNRSKEGLERLKRSLKLLLKSLSSPEHPVVLCLEDMHWIDHDSHSILKALLAFSQLKNCLFVGSFRSDEVNQEHDLEPWMQQLERDKPQAFVKVFTENLTEDNISLLLSDLLCLDPAEIQDLVSVVYSRTMGNIFHTLQLIDLLESESLLHRSTSTFRWSWDISKIKIQTSLSANVVEVVLHRILKLPLRVQDTLKVCGLIGHRLRIDVLTLVHSAIPMCLCMNDINACIEALVADGFLETLKDDQLKFTHDRIHQASLALFDSHDDKVKLHFEIGRILWEQLDMNAEDDRLIFVCTDQLNLGTCEEVLVDPGLSVRLAELNNQASKRAASYSAFVPSLCYLKIAIGLLDPTQCWMHQYLLSLDLYTSKAEMCFCAGKLDECVTAVGVVHHNARSNSDCESAEFILMNCLASQAKCQEQIDFGLSLLNKYGEAVPSNPGQFRTDTMMRRMQRLLAKKPDENILTMPQLSPTSPKAKAVRVISMMQIPLENLEKYNLHCWLTCHTVYRTLKCGLTQYSAFVFSSAAIQLVSRANDVAAGHRLADVAVKLLEKMGGEPKLAPRVLMNANFVLHWRKPLSITVDAWIFSHKKGMHCGDIHSAAMSATGYGQAYFYSGLPLIPFVKDMENFCELMYDYGQVSLLLANVPVFQCTLNLVNHSENVLDISTGKACLYRQKVGWTTRVGEHAEWSYSMQICFYCEEFEMATSFYRKVRPLFEGISRSLPLFQTRVFFYCLICIHNTKQGKRGFWKDVHSHYRILRDWVAKQKAINVVHKVLIVQAEMLTIQPRKDKEREDAIVDAFNKAIVAANRAGFLQDAALAAHLASRAVHDENTQSDFFQKACEFYERWGAYGVLAYLNRSGSQRRLSLVRPGYRARQRFHNSHISRHYLLDTKDNNQRLENMHIANPA